MAAAWFCFHLREQVRAPFQLDGGPTCHQEKKKSLKIQKGYQEGSKPRRDDQNRELAALCVEVSQVVLFMLIKVI